MRSIGVLAALVGVALLGWAVATPLMHGRETDRLVAEARQVLSPPIKGMSEVDDVDCARAQRLLDRAVELTPSHGAARRELPLAQGCAALLRGDLVLAESALRAAARAMPDDVRPQRWLGTLALARDEPEQAVESFRRCLDMDEDDIPCRVGLSDALAESGHPERALALLDEEHVPDLAIFELRRGMLYEDLDQLDEARRAYEHAIELEPQMAEPHNNLAALERSLGHYEAAWEHQAAALERAPDDALIVLNAGLLAVARGHDEEGLRHLRRAVELEQHSPDPARALADQLLIRGEAREALEVLGEAIDHYPRDAALLNTLGNALAAVGRVDEARRAYERAIEADRELAEPHNGLAALMLAEDDLTGAEEQLREALRLAPTNSHARRNLAELYRRRGELDRADAERRLARALRAR